MAARHGLVTLGHPRDAFPSVFGLPVDKKKQEEAAGVFLHGKPGPYRYLCSCCTSPQNTAYHPVNGRPIRVEWRGNVCSFVYLDTGDDKHQTKK